MKPRTRLINQHKSLYSDAHIGRADGDLCRFNESVYVLASF